ncbi:MAG: TraB/GumN family protein [Pseudomonadota bacterium]
MTQNYRASIVALIAAVLALSSCDSRPAEDFADPSPIFYEIANPDGEIEGWLLGTIHALPDGTPWRTAEIDAVIEEADLLVVEVADLENASERQAIFSRLAAAPGHTDLAERIDPAMRPELFALVDRSGYTAFELSAVDTWAVALMLAQVGMTGKPSNGVDLSVIREFDNRTVLEFEGVEKQLSIFDQLPETEQRDMLEAVIAEVADRQEDPAKLRRAYLAGDVDVLVEATETGLMADPELREAILVQRNRNWMDDLALLLDKSERPLIAVGAAHLVGPDSLNAMLGAQGYKIRSLH